VSDARFIPWVVRPAVSAARFLPWDARPTVVESEVRTSTAITARAGTVHEMTEVLRG
jgi:hypothetical protein